MSPGLFAGTNAEDETQLSCDLADAAKRERLTAHRDSYITERDFAYLAHQGIDTVRIPVPFFIFGGIRPTSAASSTWTGPSTGPRRTKSRS